MGYQFCNMEKGWSIVNWRRVLVRGVSEMSALAHGFMQPTEGFRILIYHAVGTRIPEDKLNIYTISPNAFGLHIKALADYPENSFTCFIDGLTGKGLRTAITFDDGYKDNLYTAAPILLKYQIPFTIFISTSFVQKKDARYLSPEEVRELANLPGVTIGTHGATHIPLTQCSDAELKREVGDSKHYLEDLLGAEVMVMSYPHGAVDCRVKDKVAEEGYAMAACSRFGINDRGRDPLLLYRTDILGTDSVRVFRQKLHGDWDWYRWRGRDTAGGKQKL
jgi:peptidoglycan/xylan/chitin deacetylase (PgdA/CDA1 family)